MRRFPKNTMLSMICLALTLLLTVSAASAQSEGSRRQEQNPSYLFQVALLVGSQDGSSSLADLPQNARKAIEDIQGFLSFKSYRLIDVAILRSNATGEGRISGPDGQDYFIWFTFYTDPESNQIFMRKFQLQGRVRTPEPALSGSDAGEAPPAPRSRSLMSASFSISPNETIVVGSSKLDGNGKALIVLLTAIP